MRSFKWHSYPRIARRPSGFLGQPMTVGARPTTPSPERRRPARPTPHSQRTRSKFARHRGATPTALERSFSLLIFDRAGCAPSRAPRLRPFVSSLQAKQGSRPFRAGSNKRAIGIASLPSQPTSRGAYASFSHFCIKPFFAASASALPLLSIAAAQAQVRAPAATLLRNDLTAS